MIVECVPVVRQNSFRGSGAVGNKAGQIIARGERTWLVRIFMGRDPESGKRQYHNKTIHGTRKDAQAYLNQAQRDRDLGMFFEPSRMSLDQYLDKWLETAAKPKLRAKTHRDYEALLMRYVRPPLGTRSVSKIEPLDIQTVYTSMQERGLSARTVRFTHAVLRASLHQAVKWRLIPINPAESADLPRQAKGEIQVLTPQQARDFLESAKQDRYYVLFALALTTGMRPSEYLALKWPDIDFTKGTVSVARTLEPIKGGGWQFADTKRARSRRVVKLQDWVLELLKKHRGTVPEESGGSGVPAGRGRAGQGGLRTTWTRQRCIYARYLFPCASSYARRGGCPGRSSFAGRAEEETAGPEKETVGQGQLGPKRRFRHSIGESCLDSRKTRGQ